MDESLKRRLLGAAIIVILMVAIVPMFFDDKSESRQENAEIATGQTSQRALDLPKPVESPAQDEVAATVSEATPSSPAVQSATAPESASKPARKKAGFTLVQMEETTPKPVQPAETARESVTPDQTPVVEPVEREVTPVKAITPEKTSPVQEVKAKPVVTAVTKPSSMAAPALSPSKSAARAAKPKEVSDTASKVSSTPAVTPKPKPVVASTVKISGAPVAPVARTAPSRSSEPPVAKPVSPSDAQKTVKPAAAEAAGSAWIVQAGSFSAESNARNLADKLRKRNLPVQVSIAQTSSGPLYRVTVGSALNRAKAEQIQKELESQDGVKGMILRTR